MGFEPTTLVFDQAQRFRALDRAVIVIGVGLCTLKNLGILCVFIPYLSLILHLFLSDIYNSYIVTRNILHLALLCPLDVLQFHGQVFAATRMFYFLDFIISYSFLLCFATASINKPRTSCNPFHDSLCSRGTGPCLTHVCNVATILLYLSHHIKRDVRITHFELFKIQD
jgi:hypothetical protein